MRQQLLPIVCSGHCDFSVNLSVTIRETQTGLSKDVSCAVGNTFTTSLDFGHLDSQTYPSLILQARYNDIEVQGSLANGIIRLLLDTHPALSNANKASYSISGDCDASLASGGSQVTVTMGAPDVTETVDCGVWQPLYDICRCQRCAIQA